MPKVSVIVPIYNTEKYLVKCLESLVNQTLQDIEIVAIDDGSTDFSGKIVDDFSKIYPDKIIVRHKENGGQASARNLALKLCTGEYVGFLDSDDFVDANMFEELWNKAKAEQADYVGCGYRDLLDKGERYLVLNEYVGNKICVTNREMFLNGAKVSPFINFYKRELISANDICFTEGCIYEDTAFWAKLIPFIQHPVFIEKSLANRVRHDNSTTTISDPNKIRNIFCVIEDIIKFYENKKLLGEYENEITYFCSRILLCSSVERISCVQDKKSRKDLVNDTFKKLNSLFPTYRSNILLRKNKIDIYIKYSNPLFTKILIVLLRAKRGMLKKKWNHS